MRRLLWEKLESINKVNKLEIKWATCVKRVDPVQDGGVCVSLTNGETINADIVVAADGIY